MLLSLMKLSHLATAFCLSNTESYDVGSRGLVCPLSQFKVWYILSNVVPVVVCSLESLRWFSSCFAGVQRRAG